MATFRPALMEIVAKLGHFRRRTVWGHSFRKLSASEPAPDGLPSYSKSLTDGHLRVAGVEQSDDLLVALPSALSAQLRLGGDDRREYCSIWNVVTGIDGRRHDNRIRNRR